MQLSAAEQTALLADIGETVTFAAVGEGTATTCTGFFRLPYQVVTMFDGGVSSAEPSVVLTAADAAAQSADYGRALSVRGVDYLVSEVQADNSGLVRLILTKDLS